jgi:hypothetical protein
LTDEQFRSNEEDSLHSDYQLLYSEFKNYVEQVETQAFKQLLIYSYNYNIFLFINILILERLNTFLKSKESKFFTFDQAIEKVLEKIKLENELEKLIKSFVNLNKKRTSLNDANSLNDSHNYYTLADLNSKRPETPEFIFLEHVFCLIKFSKLNEMMLTYQDLFNTFLDKLNRLIKSNPNKLVMHVGSMQFDFELFKKNKYQNNRFF